MPVNANAGEYKSLVGLKDIYVAAVTEDSATAYTTDTPEKIAPACDATFKPVVSQEMQYADDQPYDAFAAQAETDMELTFTGLPSEMQAKLTGAVFNAASGRVFDNTSTPVWFAIGFKSKKSNGKYRYYWFQKVQFTAPEEGATTQADRISPKTIKLVAKAVKTTYQWSLGSVTDSVKRVFGDEDTTNFSATGWFSAVQVPSWSAPGALSLSSSVPTDGASGISVSANQTLTFNNALVNDAVNMVFLSKTSDGTLIAMAANYPQLDATKKIMTLDPASNLTAATAYKISYAVKDIYGQWLQGIVDFTTA